MRVRIRAALFLCAASLGAPAGAQNYPVKDATGATQTMASKLNGGINFPEHVITDPTGAHGLSITTSGAAMVDGSAVTQPVSGAVTIAGTLPGFTTEPTIKLDQTAANNGVQVVNPVAVTGTFWQATQPVSVAAAPVLVAGSAIIGKVGIDQTTPGATNGLSLAEIGSTAILTGGVAGSQGVGGLAANNATPSGNPLEQSCLAGSAEPTLATNGQNAGCFADLAHKQVVVPYANKENFVSGVNTATGTNATSLLAAPGSGLFLYVTSLSCFNSGTTAVTVLFENGSGGTTIYEGFAPAGGGFIASFPVAIGGIANMTANTALFTAAGASTTTLICNAQGYKGS